MHFILVCAFISSSVSLKHITNTTNNTRISDTAAAALIRGRRLLTFLPHVRRLIEGGAYSSKYGNWEGFHECKFFILLAFFRLLILTKTFSVAGFFFCKLLWDRKNLDSCRTRKKIKLKIPIIIELIHFVFHVSTTQMACDWQGQFR